MAPDRSGAVVVRVGQEVVRMSPPKATQVVDGKRTAVQVAYRFLPGGTVGFAGRYDHHRRLLIDPTLTYTTYRCFEDFTQNPTAHMHPIAGTSTTIYQWHWSSGGFASFSGPWGSLGDHTSYRVWDDRTWATGNVSVSVKIVAGDVGGPGDIGLYLGQQPPIRPASSPITTSTCWSIRTTQPWTPVTRTLRQQAAFRSA